MTPEEAGGHTYYNEHDPFAAQWLEALIKDGQLPPGWVDTRSIVDVRPEDLHGFQHAHFFAGIGGWALALQLAQWPQDLQTWTGSCPCQPYSAAGKQHGHLDPRDLWPSWMRLIRECRPPVLLGEQVEGAIRHGWLDRLQADLEGEGYAVGAAVFGAHSVGAPHQRQRLWWVGLAQPGEGGRGRLPATPGGDLLHRAAAGRVEGPRESGDGGPAGGVAQSGGQRRQGERLHLRRGGPHPAQSQVGGRCQTGGVAQPEVLQHHGGGDAGRGRGESPDGGDVGGSEGGLGDPHRTGPQGRGVGWDGPRQRPAGAGSLAGQTFSPWDPADWLPCRDGKWRPVEPGTFPLSHGVPARVGRLRGYGNAISPQCGQVWAEVVLEALADAPL